MAKKINADDLVNWWLEKYHDTNLSKILEDNKEWAKDPQSHTREFLEIYAVTQEQCDEWEVWAKEYVRKETGYSKKYINKGWWSIYLDCSPMVK